MTEQEVVKKAMVPIRRWVSAHIRAEPTLLTQAEAQWLLSEEAWQFPNYPFEEHCVAYNEYILSPYGDRYPPDECRDFIGDYSARFELDADGNIINFDMGRD